MADRSGLNVLFVGGLPPFPVGAALSNAQLLSGLVGLGYTIRAVVPTTSELRPGEVLTIGPPGVDVTPFQVPFFDIATGIPNPEEFRRHEEEQIREKLGSLIADQRPDVVLIGREVYVPYVSELAKTNGLPCLLMVRGYPSGMIVNGTFPEALGQLFLEKYRQMDMVVTVSKHLAAGLERLGLSNVKAIANAIDVDQFSPRPKDPALSQALGIGAGATTILHLSTLSPIKRPLDIVDSAELTLAQKPELVYVILGDGQLRGRMEEACRQRHIDQAFRFVGWIDYARVPRYVNLADIVVMPSQTEGLARVYLETQACARLLLASDIPAAREVIVDGETGLLFRSGDIDDLTAKTLLAAADPDLRARIGRQARARVIHHTVDDVVAAYAATLDEVVRQHRHRTLGKVTKS